MSHRREIFPTRPKLGLIDGCRFGSILWVLRSEVASLASNPQPGGPADRVLSGLYPLTFPAWVALPGDCAPAGIALRVIEARKPPNHGKVAIHWGEYDSEVVSESFIESKRIASMQLY